VGDLPEHRAADETLGIAEGEVVRLPMGSDEIGSTKTGI
jgi:hypothetical protein